MALQESLTISDVADASISLLFLIRSSRVNQIWTFDPLHEYLEFVTFGNFCSFRGQLEQCSGAGCTRFLECSPI